MIFNLSKTNKVSYLCRLFDVSRTAYYRYRRGESHHVDKKYYRPKHEVRIEFIRNMKRYGSRRIKESLKQKGIRIGRRKVVEIMRREGLLTSKKCKPKRDHVTAYAGIVTIQIAN